MNLNITVQSREGVRTDYFVPDYLLDKMIQTFNKQGLAMVVIKPEKKTEIDEPDLSPLVPSKGFF